MSVYNNNFFCNPLNFKMSNPFTSQAVLFTGENHFQLFSNIPGISFNHKTPRASFNHLPYITDID